MRRLTSFAAVLVVLAIASIGQAKAATVADSVAEFSGTQGANNWYYGYYSGSLTPSSFALFPNYDPAFAVNEYTTTQLAPVWFPTSAEAFQGPGGWYIQWAGGYWTSLWTNGGVGNQPVAGWDRQGAEHWAVRRWISEVSGPVAISGSLGTINGGNMLTSVLVDGNEVFSQQAPSTSGTDYSFATTVSVGSQVDFIIGLDNHSVVNGATKFTATINTVPEPSTFVLLGMGAAGLLGFAWRRRKRAA